MLENHRLSAIKDGKFVLESDDFKKELNVDSVEIAVGFRPIHSMAQELQGCAAAVYEIGDGQKAGAILHAVWDECEVASTI